MSSGSALGAAPLRAGSVVIVAPLLVGAVVLGLLGVVDGDRRLASALFYDASLGHWLGHGSFWMEDLLHTGGRNIMRLIAVAALGAWLASVRVAWLTAHRRALAYLASCFALVPLLVGALKSVTGVDCPWDITGFGGDRPYVEWFADRPDGLPQAACFPGAHSSSAFALFALFFLWRGSRPLWARVALGVTVIVGALFSVAQQSRGAHFLSHDVASAMIAWAMCAGVHFWMFENQLMHGNEARRV